MVELELNSKEKIDTDDEDKQANVDWLPVRSRNYNKRAVRAYQKRARELSKREDIFEVELRAQGRDDPLIHEFYRNGELEFKMF